MRRFCKPAIISVFVLGGTVFAQTQPSGEIPERAAVVASLSNPVYPPLARQAHITGEVRLRLRLHEDGSVRSAEIIDGHPLLRQAASDSALKSEFACTECGQTESIYLLVYHFEIREGCHFGPHCEQLDSDEPLITQSAGRVTISASPLCTCDPSATLIRIRAAKCLYIYGSAAVKRSPTNNPKVFLTIRPRWCRLLCGADGVRWAASTAHRRYDPRGRRSCRPRASGSRRRLRRCGRGIRRRR